MSPPNIHASCVILAHAAAIFPTCPDDAILLLGESGAGKSRVALDLIALGAGLVADDRTELFVERGRLHARAPAALAGLLEVRGLGIVTLPFVGTAPIALAVRLVPRQAVPRLPDPANFESPAGLEVHRPIPLLHFSAEGAASRILLAAAHAATLHRHAPP
jgi:serine kinase of HPr protein (carbohydrate metabolism regulator)